MTKTSTMKAVKATPKRATTDEERAAKLYPGSVPVEHRKAPSLQHTQTKTTTVPQRGTQLRTGGK